MVSKLDDPPSTVSHYQWALYAVGLLSATPKTISKLYYLRYYKVVAPK
jgi:hypothetical protein